MLRAIRLIPVGRSHPVYRLEVDGEPVAAVKLFGPRRGETDGDAAREIAVQRLAAERAPLAALTAPAIAHSGPASLIVSRWVAGTPAWEGDSLTGIRAGTPAGDLAALVPAVMPPLAAMHRDTAQLFHRGALPPALDGPIPWGLRLFDGDAPADLWQHPSLADLLAGAARRPLLVQGVRRARGAWRKLALVHGDLKHDNLLLLPDGSACLIDWEMARLGDPAWDLAGLMFRPLLDPGLDAGWSDATIAAAGALLSAYAAASGLAVAPLAQRLLLYCGVWLLMSVIQYRSTAAAHDEEASDRLLTAAETAFAGCDRIVAQLLDALRAA